jgi:hypothetical protein
LARSILAPELLFGTRTLSEPAIIDRDLQIRTAPPSPLRN